MIFWDSQLQALSGETAKAEEKVGRIMVVLPFGFAERSRNCRALLGLSQVELAKQAKLYRSTVYDVEEGRRIRYRKAVLDKYQAFFEKKGVWGEPLLDKMESHNGHPRLVPGGKQYEEIRRRLKDEKINISALERYMGVCKNRIGAVKTGRRACAVDLYLKLKAVLDSGEAKRITEEAKKKKFDDNYIIPTEDQVSRWFLARRIMGMNIEQMSLAVDVCEATLCHIGAQEGGIKRETVEKLDKFAKVAFEKKLTASQYKAVRIDIGAMRRKRLKQVVGDYLSRGHSVSSLAKKITPKNYDVGSSILRRLVDEKRLKLASVMTLSIAEIENLADALHAPELELWIKKDLGYVRKRKREWLI